MPRSHLSIIALSLLAAVLPVEATAQETVRDETADEGEQTTIKDDVEKHVKDSLEQAKQDAQKKKEDKKKEEKKTDDEQDEKSSKAAQKQASSEDDDDDVVVWEDPEAAAEPGYPKPPFRVFHKYFKLDLVAGAGYRGWAPQQYPAVAVDMANYFTWSVGAKARLFNTVNLNRAYYETNNAASPRESYLADAAKIGSYALKAAWFLAELGVPILDAWEPTIRYETRSFQTTARVKQDYEVCVIPFDQDTDVSGCEPTTEPLSVVSSFESAVLGVRYHPGKDPSAVIHQQHGKAPRFLIGGAYMSYVKPYQVTIGDAVLDEYLFTGRFYGGGLAVGVELGGGVNNIDLDLWTQFGLGKVRLTRDLTLNELAPEDWLIGYVQGNASLSYRWAPFDFAPSLLIVPAGAVSGASFFFFETEVDEGEETATPTINWDVLYTVRLTLIITL